MMAQFPTVPVFFIQTVCFTGRSNIQITSPSDQLPHCHSISIQSSQLRSVVIILTLRPGALTS
jgi:hypothetical protein